MIDLIAMKDIIVFVLFIFNFYLKHIIRLPPPDEEDPQLLNDDCCCSICLDEISQDSVRTFECNHYFHLSCLNEWVRKSATCPVCRTKLNVIHTIQIN